MQCYCIICGRACKVTPVQIIRNGWRHCRECDHVFNQLKHSVLVDLGKDRLGSSEAVKPGSNPLVLDEKSLQDQVDFLCTVLEISPSVLRRCYPRLVRLLDEKTNKGLKVEGSHGADHTTEPKVIEYKEVG